MNIHAYMHEFFIIYNHLGIIALVNEQAGVEPH